MKPTERRKSRPAQSHSKGTHPLGKPIHLTPDQKKTADAMERGELGEVVYSSAGMGILFLILSNPLNDQNGWRYLLLKGSYGGRQCYVFANGIFESVKEKWVRRQACPFSTAARDNPYPANSGLHEMLHAGMEFQTRQNLIARVIRTTGKPADSVRQRWKICSNPDHPKNRMRSMKQEVELSNGTKLVRLVALLPSTLAKSTQ